MSILSFMVPTGCLPISECLGVRRPNWDPRNTAGEDWEMGGSCGWGCRGTKVKGPTQPQVNLGFSKPPFTWEVVDRLNMVSMREHSWARACVCVWVCVQECGCLVQAEDACVPGSVFVCVCVHVRTCVQVEERLHVSVCDCECLSRQMCKHLGCGHWQTTSVTVCACHMFRILLKNTLSFGSVELQGRFHYNQVSRRCASGPCCPRGLSSC